MITVTFKTDQLTLRSDDDLKMVVLFYREHPSIFGHPRFLIANFEQAATLVKVWVRQISRRWRWLAPKVVVRVERKMEGGLTDIDRNVLRELFMQTGAREVVIEDASGT